MTITLDIGVGHLKALQTLPSNFTNVTTKLAIHLHKSTMLSVYLQIICHNFIQINVLELYEYIREYKIYMYEIVIAIFSCCNIRVRVNCRDAFCNDMNYTRIRNEESTRLVSFD